MHKIVLSLALLAGLAQNAQAQHSRIGFKAGVALANFVGADVSSTSSTKTGFCGGLLFDLGINDRLSIQPELLYSMKGVKDELRGSGGTVSGSQTLHYVDVPILLKLRVASLFLEAGPQAGVLVAATQTISQGSASNSIDDKSAFNGVDLGYALGLGLQAHNGLLLGLRYNGGFSNVAKPLTQYGSSIQAQARNSVFQLYAGILLPGK